MFFAAGCWHPDSDALGKIRDLIAQKPEKWFATRDDKKFTSQWALWGDSLTRPPRGYAADHIAIEDIKRKDYVALAPLSSKEIIGKGLVALAEKRFTESVQLMKFLCTALEVPFKLPKLRGLISNIYSDIYSVAEITTLL